MTNEKIELRNFDVSLSEVNETSEGLFVRGIVNRPGEWSQPLPGKGGKAFIERIMPKAFSKAIERNANIKFLANHDKNVMLSSMKNKTLKLEERADGLYMEATIVPSDLGKHTYALIKSGELSHMSFGMAVLADTWEKVGGMMKRSISDLFLSEVSVVADPAYTQSAIEARSEEMLNEIEIPEMEERDFKTMNKKELLERQQDLLDEVEALQTVFSEEKRSANTAEELREKVILNELNKIDEQLQELESKTKTYQKEEKRNMENVETNDIEKRGYEQFITLQDGEEARSLQTTSDPGKLMVPTHLADEIIEKLNENAPLFSRTKNYTPVAGFLEIMRESTIGSAQFVAEGDSVTLNDFTATKIKLDQKRIASGIEISNQFINDSGIDIVGYATRILARRVAQALDNSVLIGDKATQFEGVLVDPGNSIQKVTTAAVGAITADDLLDLQNSMHPDLQAGAVYVVNRKTFNAIAKLKDGNGHYFLVRDVAETGVSYKLFGQDVIINDTMPEPVANMKAVLFANFAEGYATMTKKNMELHRVNNDTANVLKGTHTFVLETYADGKVLMPDALKVLVVKSAA